MADRRELGREMCRRLAHKVRDVVPPGVGQWDPAFEIIREPTDRFIDAVDAWVDDANSDTKEMVRQTSRELVAAWREAGRRYVEAGRPKPGVPA